MRKLEQGRISILKYLIFIQTIFFQMINQIFLKLTGYQLIFLIGVTNLFFSCQGSDSSYENTSNSRAGFVSLQGDSFMLDNNYFYPITVNYLVSLLANEHEVWTVSSVSYYQDNKPRHAEKDSGLAQLAYEMELIKDMGFNSVRFVGVGEVKPHNGSADLLSIHAFDGNDRDTTLVLSDSIAYARYMHALNELVKIAGDAGLKVVLLTRVNPDTLSTERHLQKLATSLKDNAALMAYDLFNEPLYFDPNQRLKSDVSSFTKRWDDIVNRYAPHHLTTIGLTGMREVFIWDPNVLQVDFISFHPYEYEPDQVRNEIFWYHTYVSKPWIIGETAIPADGDSVSYDLQTAFAAKTMKQSWDCYASGYSWWQYQDVKWPKFHSSYMGVVNRKGTTVTSKGNLVSGTVKPLVSEFQNFVPATERDSCKCFSNYYNYSESPGYRLTGKIINGNGSPIEGAVILAWSTDWLQSNHTVSKPDGSFELKADFWLNHWIASATNYTMIREYIHPDKIARVVNGDSIVNIGVITIEKLKLAN